MRKKVREGQAPDPTVDEESAKRLKEIIAEIDWPTISKVVGIAAHLHPMYNRS